MTLGAVRLRRFGNTGANSKTRPLGVGVCFPGYAAASKKDGLSESV